MTSTHTLRRLAALAAAIGAVTIAVPVAQADTDGTLLTEAAGSAAVQGKPGGVTDGTLLSRAAEVASLQGINPGQVTDGMLLTEASQLFDLARANPGSVTDGALLTRAAELRDVARINPGRISDGMLLTEASLLYQLAQIDPGRVTDSGFLSQAAKRGPVESVSVVQTGGFDWGPPPPASVPQPVQRSSRPPRSRFAGGARSLTRTDPIAKQGRAGLLTPPGRRARFAGMRIVRITARNVGFSRAPVTLARHLVSNASLFEDFEAKPGGWFGDVVCTVVEVEADDGTVGVGTAGGFHGGALDLVASVYADLVLGEDPRRHEHLWQSMYRTTVRFGRSGPAVAALSALDIACWDLHGKAEGKPVCDLLGGRTQTRVPCYVSRLYALDDPDELAEEARGHARAGFIRMKQRFGFGPKDGREGMKRNVELVRTVREAVGDGVELAADAYMGWDTGYAIEMAKRLRDFDLSWIEEPLMPHDVAGYVELKQRCPWQRWSCGEHSYTKWDFQELIDRRAVDILQPDVNRVGGLTEALKVCALAETAGLPVVPHSNEAHNLHLVFSRSPAVCPVIEYFPDVEPDTGNELFWKLFRGNPEARGGTLELSERPGLGVELVESVLSELQVGAERVAYR